MRDLFLFRFDYLLSNFLIAYFSYIHVKALYIEHDIGLQRQQKVVTLLHVEHVVIVNVESKKTCMDIIIDPLVLLICRSYYRCTHHGCNVKKQVQRLTKDEGVVVTTYEGVHTHPIEKTTDNFEHILNQMQIYTPF